MNIFFEEHRNLIANLLTEDVKFILVGGYAVNYYGYNRTTGDMDIWLKPDNENKLKLISALEKENIDADDLEEIKKLDFTNTLVFSAWDPPYKVDFLTKVSGVTYDEADEAKIIADVENMPIPFINIHHLVLTKIATGRLQDKTDIEKLQQIQQQRK